MVGSAATWLVARGIQNGVHCESYGSGIDFWEAFLGLIVGWIQICESTMPRELKSLGLGHVC